MYVSIKPFLEFCKPFSVLINTLIYICVRAHVRACERIIGRKKKNMQKILEKNINKCQNNMRCLSLFDNNVIIRELPLVCASMERDMERKKTRKCAYIIKKNEFPCIIEKKVVILQPDLLCGIVYTHKDQKKNKKLTILLTNKKNQSDA